VPCGHRSCQRKAIARAMVLRMPTETVQIALDFLKQHNMALAVPLGFVSSDTCGQDVEGIGSARGQNVYPREMTKRGIDLDYVVMDEPVFYGHDYAGKNACKFSIEEVAESVAKNVKMIRSYYPKVQFVLVEPEQSLTGGVQELEQVPGCLQSQAQRTSRGRTV